MAGDTLTFTLRLFTSVLVILLHVQPQLQLILALLIFTDFIAMSGSLGAMSCLDFSLPRCRGGVVDNWLVVCFMVGFGSWHLGRSREQGLW